MLAHLRQQVTAQLARVELVQQPPQLPDEDDMPPMFGHHVDPFTGEDEMALAELEAAGAPTITLAARPGPTPAARDARDPATWGKVGRNEPCPCGSGKKFKHCHGQLA
jgi:preprotein translocase subunit SecA